jgi:urease accessory protein
MTIVEKVWAIASVGGQYPSYSHDTVTLTWEERRQGHGKRRSDGGIEFAISLPDGAILKNGDCFILDEERTIMKVREALEPVYIVRPDSSKQWAFYAYHVGNRHQAIMIGDHELIFLQNPAVRSLLDQLKVAYCADSRPFSGALVLMGHSH